MYLTRPVLGSWPQPPTEQGSPPGHRHVSQTPSPAPGPLPLKGVAFCHCLQRNSDSVRKPHPGLVELRNVAGLKSAEGWPWKNCIVEVKNVLVYLNGPSRIVSATNTLKAYCKSTWTEFSFSWMDLKEVRAVTWPGRVTPVTLCWGLCGHCVLDTLQTSVENNEHPTHSRSLRKRAESVWWLMLSRVSTSIAYAHVQRGGRGAPACCHVSLNLHVWQYSLVLSKITPTEMLSSLKNNF